MNRPDHLHSVEFKENMQVYVFTILKNQNSRPSFLASTLYSTIENSRIRQSFQQYGEIERIERPHFIYNDKKIYNGNIIITYKSIKKSIPTTAKYTVNENETLIKIRFNDKIMKQMLHQNTEKQSTESSLDENMEGIPKSQETKTPASSVVSKRNSMDSTESNESKESTLTFSKIQSYYKKNFVFRKKKFKTGPDTIVTPQTRWKITSACLSIWYPE